MSNINKQALREAAGKAISEEGETWWNEEQLASDYGLALHRADANFIAAANPANVLALLDELEAAEKRTAELERERDLMQAAALAMRDDMRDAREANDANTAELVAAGIITKVGE
ncbi:ead/Ea22-like family protein [Enterobacter hormaechei]